jgi:8-oxo-dGTP diphosphatase
VSEPPPEGEPSPQGAGVRGDADTGRSDPARAPRVAVGAIVIAGDRVLLVERGAPPGVGLWTVPGGKLERGEHLAAAVVREVREETGLAVQCGPLVDVVERAGDDYHFVILDYLATVDGGGAPVPVAGGDARAARWVAWSELAALPLTSGLIPVLERARSLVHLA